MYRLLGSDQKEYGPLSAEDVRRCIVERRAHRLTLARAEADVGWKPLGDFAEFHDLLVPTASPAPPSVPSLSAPPPAVSAPPTPPPLMPASRTSGLAIASLVLGVLGFCGITGLAGLILGILALAQIRRSAGTVKGTGLAVAGIIVSAVMLAALIIAAIAVPLAIMKQQRQFGPGGPAFNPQPTLGRPQNWTSDPDRCAANVKAITLGALRSASGNDGRFPDGSNWCDTVQVYLPALSTLRCPSDGSNDRCSYGFNAAVSGLPTNQVSPRTVVIFESRSGWNLTGGSSHTRTRHGGVMVGFADGTTAQIAPGQEGTLRWEP
jgi:hypothetical protein